jgi:hypothetical protein
MSGWARVAEELDRWDGIGATATFWWRDDDAVGPTSQLDHLLECAGHTPIALAVIPNLTSEALAERLDKQQSVVVLQHGWRHANYAGNGRNEYPGNRTAADVSRELRCGRDILSSLFGAQAIPVFAPPWHGFDDCFLPLLRENGITAISRKGPRPAAWATDDVFQANAHVSPITWTDPPSFGDDDSYLGQFLDHLRGRRLGSYDRAEPTGLLTHHLVQDTRSFDFIARFIDLVSSHPAATWLDAKAVFAPGFQ